MKEFGSLSEVYDYLQSKGLGRLSSFLSEAVEQETKDLCGMNSDTPEVNRKDAEQEFLDEINYFLGQGDFDSINPRIIINYRRKPKSWAIAAMIGETYDNKRDKTSD